MSTRAQNRSVSGGDRARTPLRPHNKRLVALTVVLCAVVLAADQLTKWWAESALTLNGDSIRVIGDLITLRLIYNSGAALSLATGLTWLLTIVVVIVVAVLIRLIRRIGSRGWSVSFGLLLGGALGNLTDRLVRDPGFARGHVVDFIDYAGFFVGNVADIAIVAAAIVIVILSMMGIGIDGRREVGASSSTQDSASSQDDDTDQGADAVHNTENGTSTSSASEVQRLGDSGASAGGSDA